MLPKNAKPESAPGLLTSEIENFFLKKENKKQPQPKANGVEPKSQPCYESQEKMRDRSWETCSQRLEKILIEFSI
jgi:hypothetical protein